MYEAENLPNFDEISKAAISSALDITGTFILTPDAKQPFEVHAESIEIEAPSDSDYPLQKKRHSVEYLREIAHLRPRSNLFSAVFRVRSVAAYAAHKFFQDRGFIYCTAPILTGSDAEGAGEMFHVTNFDLANVPLNEDGIFASAFKNVYTFGPTFRAENSNTMRHASEFWMIEPEMSFMELPEMMDVGEDMIKFMITYTMEHASQEIDFLNTFVDKGLKERLTHVAETPFVRITYTEAVEQLEASGADFEFPVYWGVDLATEHERYLTEQIYKAPVFVTDYPKEIKAFYMRMNDDNKTVAACDCLVPGIGEIIGGSQREERLDVLEARMDELGMDKTPYWWYLELRKYGGVKHSGYGLGFERMVMYLTGVDNIRDVLPFPRTPRTLDF